MVVAVRAGMTKAASRDVCVRDPTKGIDGHRASGEKAAGVEALERGKTGMALSERQNVACMVLIAAVFLAFPLLSGGPRRTQTEADYFLRHDVPRARYIHVHPDVDPRLVP